MTSSSSPESPGDRSADRRQVTADLDRQFRTRGRRAWVTRGLFALAALIVVQHLLAHAGWRPLPLAMAAQDLFIGYPVGGVIALAGPLCLGHCPHRWPVRLRW